MYRTLCCRVVVKNLYYYHKIKHSESILLVDAPPHLLLSADRVVPGKRGPRVRVGSTSAVWILNVKGDRTTVEVSKQRRAFIKQAHNGIGMCSPTLIDPNSAGE